MFKRLLDRYTDRKGLDEQVANAHNLDQLRQTLWSAWIIWAFSVLHNSDYDCLTDVMEASISPLFFV